MLKIPPCDDKGKIDRHCFSCNKTFHKPSDYKKHKNRKTPCLIQDVPEGDTAPNRCRFCNKSYTLKRNLTRHYKKCKIANGGTDILMDKLIRDKEITDLRTKNAQQAGELKACVAKLEAQDKKMDTMMEMMTQMMKTQNTSQTGININGDNNTQNVTINNYMAPDMSNMGVTMKNLSGMPICLGLVKVIFFNPDKPQNRSIMVKNIKDGRYAAYTDGKWNIIDGEELRIDVSNVVQKQGRALLNANGGPGSKEVFTTLTPGERNRVISFNGYKEEESKIILKDLVTLMYNNK